MRALEPPPGAPGPSHSRRLAYSDGTMDQLREHLGEETLIQLARSFSAAAGAPVWVLSADGQVLAGDGTPPARAITRAVLAEGGHVLTVALAARRPGPRAGDDRLLDLMHDVLERLCAQAAKLRARAEELAAMYHLTEVFTGRTEMKEVHQLVAETMVEVTGADACSIRILDEGRSELLTTAAAGLSDAYMT